ncbi:MAG TPA: AraC family transcriptional regulator [Gemmatimonadales bacterium]|jgi:AraC family transcriptional regulator|nr:AraC family transcriptional regulator [Gemmatimonadales bacterium]
MGAIVADGSFYGEVCRSRRVTDLVLAETQYPAGAVVPMHAHESPLLCFVVRGAFQEESRGHRRTLGRGSVLFHPRDEPHAHRFDVPRTRCFSVVLGPCWLGEVSPVEGTRLSGPSDHSRGRLPWLGRQLHEEFGRGEQASLLVLEGLLLTVLGELTRRNQRPDSGRAAWVNRARELVEAQLRQPFRLTRLAAQLGVHPAHLSRTFRHAFGESLSAYVLRRRVELAAAALADPDVPLAQVALETGFADQSHLCRSFRRVTGLTPGAWRHRR